MYMHSYVYHVLVGRASLYAFRKVACDFWLGENLENDEAVDAFGTSRCMDLFIRVCIRKIHLETGLVISISRHQTVQY